MFGQETRRRGVFVDGSETCCKHTHTDALIVLPCHNTTHNIRRRHARNFPSGHTAVKIKYRSTLYTLYTTGRFLELSVGFNYKAHTHTHRQAPSRCARHSPSVCISTFVSEMSRKWRQRRRRRCDRLPGDAVVAG